MSNQETKIRKSLHKLGLGLHKSRSKSVTADNFCEYMVYDPYNNLVIAGSKFDLSLDDIVEMFELS